MFMHIKPGMQIDQWASGFHFSIAHDSVKVMESYPTVVLRPGVATVDCVIAVNDHSEGYAICPTAEDIS